MIAIRKILILCLLSIGTLGNLCAKENEPYLLLSPNGKLAFRFTLESAGPVYSIAYKNHTLVDNSLLNLDLEGLGLLENPFYETVPVTQNKEDRYRLVVGKAGAVTIRYRQVNFSLLSNKNKDYRIQIQVRVFDDGIALRYWLPQEKDRMQFTLLDEKTEIRVKGDPMVKSLLLPNYTSSHEGLYTTLPFSQLPADTLMDMPTLFQFPDKIFMAITEAALVDYAGMYLMKHDNMLLGKLSPLPDESGIKVKASLPHGSPWRVFLINDRVGALLESNIITSLNDPLAIKDVSWLHPGTTTFPWWNGTIIPDSIKGGNNFETNKYYIDFCAANHIRYHSIVEYGGHEWYTNDGTDYQPGLNSDITRPVAGLDMKEVCDYAHKKGVEVRVWTHWKALYPKLDSAFAIFQRWGLSGMMVDFMDRDDQFMVNIQSEILRKAAAHHLHIQFHGAYKPTGLSRTWPNEFTREGTLNYEHDKWDNLVDPDADMNIVYTRLLAGSTDYHLGGFRALPYEKFVVQNFRPYVMGTRCHMLAMYVVLENYLSMVCDDPAAYIGQPGFEVLQQIPTTWDETRVIGGEVDQYVSIARRNKANWYIGTITNKQPREVRIDFRFLPAGNYSATVYSDAPDANENANHLVKQIIPVNRNSQLKLILAPGGGNFILIKKLVK